MGPVPVQIGLSASIGLVDGDHDFGRSAKALQMSLEGCEIFPDAERELALLGLEEHEIDERDQDAQRSVEPASEACDGQAHRGSSQLGFLVRRLQVPPEASDLTGERGLR